MSIFNNITPNLILSPVFVKPLLTIKDDKLFAVEPDKRINAVVLTEITSELSRNNCS